MPFKWYLYSKRSVPKRYASFFHAVASFQKSTNIWFCGSYYNQIVRAVNTHFSHTAIPRQVLLLERRTRELKALSEQVIALSRELYELWSRG